MGAMASRLWGRAPAPGATPGPADRVTLCDVTSGERIKFLLSPEGRVDVDAVLTAMDATAVKLEEADGCLSVLERLPAGLSRNVFVKDSVINVRPVRMFSRGRREPAMIYDVDLPIADIGPSLLIEVNDKLNVYPKVFTWKDIKTNELQDRGGKDVQEELVAGSQEGWRVSERLDEQLVKQHLETLGSWIGLPITSFNWLEAGKRWGMKRIFYEGLKISNSSDAILCESRHGAAGAVLGISLRTELTWTEVYRAHLEFLLWAAGSALPYVQLVTDMKNGGMFYMCAEGDAGRSVLFKVVLQDMSEVAEFCEAFGQGLPSDDSAFKLQQFDPPIAQAKLPYPGCTFPSFRET